MITSSCTAPSPPSADHAGPETHAAHDLRIKDWSESLNLQERERAIAGSRTTFVSEALPDGSSTHPEGCRHPRGIQAARKRAHPDEIPCAALPRD